MLAFGMNLNTLRSSGASLRERTNEDLMWISKVEMKHDEMRDTRNYTSHPSLPHCTNIYVRAPTPPTPSPTSSTSLKIYTYVRSAGGYRHAVDCSDDVICFQIGFCSRRIGQHARDC